MRMKMWKRMILAILMVGLLVPTAGRAQTRSWTYLAPTGGWIGITVDFNVRSAGEKTETLVVVREVVGGSPADIAGIKVGDTITQLDGQSVSERLFASLPENLEVGDTVTIVIDRDERSREYLVEAAQRPRSQIRVGPDAERMVIELGALRGNIIKDLDSLLVSIEGLHLDSTTGGVGLQIVRVPSRLGDEGEFGFRFEVSKPFVDSLYTRPDVFVATPEFAMPFEAFLVDSRETAQIKEDLTNLRKQLTAVRRQELARQRELAAAIQGPIEEILRRDKQIQEMKVREAELVAQQEELTARLRQVSEEVIQHQWVDAQGRSEEVFARARDLNLEAVEEARRERVLIQERARDMYEVQREQFRSPVIVGQSMMLGAQLAPLNPELAQYFSVDEGVMVVEVIEGTPASEAGLQGGDIIVTVAGEEVTSLSDLRFGLGAFEGPLRIQVIRKGEPVEISIRR
jgi:membrane-associated protease RseP (regulator of RpoE activity)